MFERKIFAVVEFMSEQRTNHPQRISSSACDGGWSPSPHTVATLQLFLLVQFDGFFHNFFDFMKFGLEQVIWTAIGGFYGKDFLGSVLLGM